MIEPILKRNALDETFTQMKNMIFKKDWLPGAKIPSENELCKQLNVSRVTVRSSIQKLAALNLLEARVGEGTFVKNIDASVNFVPLVSWMTFSNEEQSEIVEVRSCIERYCAKRAAINKADVSHLQWIVEQMKECYDNNKILEYVEFDYQFHLTIIELSKNNIFYAIFSTLKETLFFHYEKSIKTYDTMKGFKLHKDMIQAIKNQEVDRIDNIYDELFFDVLEIRDIC